MWEYLLFCAGVACLSVAGVLLAIAWDIFKRAGKPWL